MGFTRKNVRRKFFDLLLPASYLVAVLLLPSLHTGGLFYSHPPCCHENYGKIFAPPADTGSTASSLSGGGGAARDGEECQICRFTSTFAQMAEFSSDAVSVWTGCPPETKVLRSRPPCKPAITSHPPTAPPFGA